ncbi:predicted protein [Naegleria gruberi]|uniref:Predicted protein n=1 Tax=Naegleria gruberi TaxID=5762 RepID=D2VDM2_NAEGR|nr:uncharacterized protein NAEGRDRAFT_76389 [Naegleria gruberi]XP_002677770.1 uncharacterized protein NAEGRDRAFT_66970 [Naegleria gruberi]EFC35950.1 predicted protein [Naegleria gruberi]EFC45026.1 predicted protein [Naegleria gruberi]|eukprot:XP_002668694.1 predicted protein [Naegleria gruberi strain NEG-M]
MFHHYIPAASLLLSGIVHLLPLSGLLGSRQLEKLYGIPINEENLEILMRHRAVLFGLLGTFHCYGAFRPELYGLAFGSGIVSVASFIWLSRLSKKQSMVNRQIVRVCNVDIVVLMALSLGMITSIYFNE